MWSIHPFQKHMCVLYLSIVLITSYISLNHPSYTTNDDIFQLNDTLNASFVNEYFDFNNTVGDVETSIKYHFEDFLNQSNASILKYNISKQEIYILGLFELSTKWGERREGVSETLAAKLAVNHVNNLNVLPGYTLTLLINDTKCDPGIGIDRFFHALYSNKTITMLLGTGCSNVTESLAHVVPYWNILQVSFGSTSPSLSDRNKFPLFFRTAAPDSSHNTAKIHFLKEFGWRVVATLSQSENAYLLPLNNLVTELEKVNITCLSTITFSIDNYKEQLKVLKDLDIRIIIASFSIFMATKIFCEAFDLNMYGGDYVWIIQNEQELWWLSDKDCIISNLNKAVEGIIFVSDYDGISNDELSISGLDESIFEQTLNISRGNISKYAKQTYDAVWAMALTLRETQIYYWMDPLEDFHYKRKDMVCKFLDKMSALNFMGLSGPVKFHGADRIGNSILRQIQGNHLSNIAIFDSVRNRLNFNCKQCQEIYWKDGHVPIAQRILKISLITIPEMIFYFIVAICLLGICASFWFLYFNLHFRRMKTVKLSSPNLNNVAVFGCILVYSSVILLGLHNIITISNGNFSKLCMIRVYLLSAGFSLAFGSMFAKTYRVHRLFTYFGVNLIKDKLLKDKQLIVLILIPLIIDGIIIALWVMIDPMERNLHNLTLELSLKDPGVVYQPQVEVCRSQNTIGWYIALYGYKGLILIMGVFMAWKTRHIKVPGLNDSQYIGICVYSAVFSAIIVVLCSFISNYVIFSYMARTATIIMSTTITLFLLFLPKLKSVFGKVQVGDPIMQSMGLKIECNTRRFITHDPKELIYRLEIQNKVYKCELEALDKEIMRLEELLLDPSTTCSTKSSVNVIETAADCYYLNIPAPTIARASWPTAGGQFLTSRTDFLSENKLNENFFEKFNIVGKLKRFFGSIPTVKIYSNSSRGIGQMENKIKFDKEKPQSNPDFYSQLLVSTDTKLIKAKSETNINNRVI